MKFLNDLFSTEGLLLYEKTEYPFNLSILHAALKDKLEEDPDYEVWVPLVYYTCKQYKRSKNWPDVIKPYQVVISNKGNVRSLEKGLPTPFERNPKQ